MKYPVSDSTIGYVSSSSTKIFSRELNKLVEYGIFTINPYLNKEINSMTYGEFKERYPLDSKLHWWMRYKSKSYK